MDDDYGYIVYPIDHTGRFFDRVKNPDMWHTCPTESQWEHEQAYIRMAEEIRAEIDKEIIASLTKCAMVKIT